MIFPSIVNPWVILTFVATLGLTNAFTLMEGREQGADGERGFWLKAEAESTERRIKRIQENQEKERKLQAGADEQRGKDAKTINRLRGNLDIALNGLRDRPVRPAEGGGAVSASAGAGPGGPAGCTGGGLFRDDAGFLARYATAAQVARIQRDACYARYGAARETLKGAEQ